MDQNTIWRSIRIRAKELSKKMTDEQLYTSDAYRTHVQATVDGLTKDLQKHVSVQLEHSKENAGEVAYTNGNAMHLNTANAVASWYSLPESRFSANMGIVYHELAHIRFHDFRADKIADEELKKGRLYGKEPQGINDDELDEMLDALKKAEYAPVFFQLRREIINCIIDAHDEERMCDTYGGVIARCIQLAASSMEGQLITLEYHTNQKLPPLTIMTELILQFARFGEIFVAEEETLNQNEYALKLAAISPAIERAVVTDDPEEMYAQVNKILLFLWPYIKKALEDAEKKNADNPTQANDNSGQNDQQQGGGSQSPSQQAIQQVLQQIAQAAQNVGGTQMPTEQNTSSAAKKATREAKSKNSKEGNDPQKATGAAASAAKNDPAAQRAADAATANTMHTIISSAGNDMAEAEMMQDLKTKVAAEIAIADRSSTHRDHPIDVKREVDVSQTDRDLYAKQMVDVQQYSKRLAKLMQQELKDLQDGDTRRGRTYGRDIVAGEMWRPDRRYFSDTKLPQDLPDMAVAVLVDQSGSMQGNRMDAAMKATMLLYDYAERVHFPVAVYGHNVTTFNRVNLYVYSDFLKSDKRDAYRLAKLSTGGRNRDGAALEIVAGILDKRPEKTKLLIIISDGKPNDTAYGGDSAAKDIARIVAKSRRRGIEIIAAAIGDDKPYLKKIYGDGFLDITDLSTFPKAMVKLVKKRLKV